MTAKLCRLDKIPVGIGGKEAIWNVANKRPLPAKGARAPKCYWSRFDAAKISMWLPYLAFTVYKKKKTGSFASSISSI